MAYGKELIMDLYECDVKKFTREYIEKWLKELCKLIGMQRADLHWWDYKGEKEKDIPYDQPHLVGTSAIQFITTSDIVIHTLDMLGECYINIFTCKEFDAESARRFTMRWFCAKVSRSQVIARGSDSQCNNVFESNCMECVSHGKCSGNQMFCDGFRRESKTERW